MKAKLYGYSDDCHNFELEGEDPFGEEYSEKRLIITLPDGSEVTATLKFAHGWEVSFEIPDTCTVRAEKLLWESKKWEAP